MRWHEQLERASNQKADARVRGRCLNCERSRHLCAHPGVRIYM